jgi:hypothetical protein
MNERSILISRAASLARARPEEWKAFVAALAAYVEIQRNNVVNSPLPELPVNQGRAQFGTQMVLLMDNCLQEDEQQRKVTKP